VSGSEWVFFLAAAESCRDFFNRVFEPPLLRSAQKRDKKTRARNNGGGRVKKKRRKKNQKVDLGSSSPPSEFLA
jgi:hypothetical protein